MPWFCGRRLSRSEKRVRHRLAAPPWTNGALPWRALPGRLGHFLLRAYAAQPLAELPSPDRPGIRPNGELPDGASFAHRIGPHCRIMNAPRQVHGSCAARDGEGVLVLGEAGAGKSDLLLRLLSRGFTLVADDQVEIADGCASPPAALAGLLEVRGLGIVRLPYLSRVRLAIVVQLATDGERLPGPVWHADLGLPLIRISAASASAADRVSLALDCALGKVSQLAGAFAA